jgi:sulfite reductase alpha subunit-like flavoprotein
VIAGLKNILEGTMTESESNSVSNLRSCTILWSTQSGRAKACARRVARILREQTVTVVTVGGEVDQYSFCERALEGTFPLYHWWLFLVSTTGDGEQCDCIQQTWRAL